MRAIRLILLVAAVLGFTVTAQAQTALTSTTASAAVTNLAATSLTVASATGITAGSTGLFVVTTGEWMTVTSVSGTTIGVNRGQGPLGPWPIANSALILIVPYAAQSYTNKYGDCSTGANIPQYFQFVNIATGDVNVCQLSGTWQQRNGLPITRPTTVVLTR